MRINRFFFVLLTLSGFEASGQNLKETISLIETKNFFKAKENYLLHRASFSLQENELIESFLYNGFNQPKESNQKISQFLKHSQKISDTLLVKLYKLKADDAVKLYRYKEAKNSLEYILNNFKSLLSESELTSIKNLCKIWTALQNEPAQKVLVDATYRVKMKVDKAGFNNLTVSAGKDSVDFIFDTGANISTVLESTAKKLQMKIIPADIKVGTITGQKISAQLAVCPKLNLGSIKIQNAVFLVFEDSAMYFPEINYRINGILGFPVINALREIKITQDGYFTVPKTEAMFESSSNMALDGLIPLIYIDGKHYTFDTGAEKTILYSAFYLENKKEIDQKYSLTKLGFAGAAGNKEFDGFVIDQDFHILDKSISLKEVQLLKDKVREEEVVYGNVGQDLIKQFQTMTLNFDKMFIKFE